MTRQGFGGAMRRGVVWSTTAFVAARLLTLVSMIIIARLLAPEEIGVLAAIIVYVGVVELVSDLGMRAAIVYDQGQGGRARVDTAFTLNLILAVALSLLAYMAAPAVAEAFQAGASVDLFRLAALNPLLVAAGNVQDALLLRDLRFRERLVPQVVRAAVRGGGSIALALAGLGAAALVVGLLAGTLAWSLTLWLISDYRPRLRIERAQLRSLVHYGSGAAALELLAIATTKADAVVIGAVLGPAALGIYFVAYRIPEVTLESLAWNVSAVAFPALSRERNLSRDALRRGMTQLLRFQAVLTLPAAAGLAIVAPTLIPMLFGPQWQEAGEVATAIAILCGLSACCYPLGDAFKALGRQRVLVAINCVFLPVLVAGIVLAAPWGLEAVAWTRVTSQALFTVVLMFACAYVLGLGAGKLWSALVPGVACAGAVVLVCEPLMTVIPAGLVQLAACVSAGGLAAVAVAVALVPDLRAYLSGRFVAGRHAVSLSRPGAESP